MSTALKLGAYGYRRAGLLYAGRCLALFFMGKHEEPTSGAKAQPIFSDRVARVNSRPSHFVAAGSEDVRFRVHLLLEQILKSLTGVIGTQGSGSGGLLLHHDAHGVKRALVALVLTRDPFRNGLSTLEPA